MYDNEHKKPLPLEWRRRKQVSVLVCLTISPYLETAQLRDHARSSFVRLGALECLYGCCDLGH